MFRKLAVAAVIAFVSQAEAIQIKSNTKLNTAVETHTENQAQWGFLKNIVNIDRFFDSGVKAWGV